MDLAFWISFVLTFVMIMAVLVALGMLVFPLPL
jgi:hypothetical protein